MSSVYFDRKGKGKKVILLHGFPMDHSIWNDFSSELSNEFQVVTPDLPGFGKSESLSSPFTLDQVAEVLIRWIEKELLHPCTIIGHSLGGYITLAIAEKRPDLLSAIGLFHSTAYADSSEKKESRSKVLTFIDAHGVQAFTSNFITPLFANSDHPAIPFIREVSQRSAKESVKGYTIAMRERPDRTETLKNFAKPVLILGGVNDQGMDVDSLKLQAGLNKRITLALLKDSAHMGMMEEVVESLTTVRSFLNNL
jgi:pimeloyl-ACP methyl ester carboxylesterase